MWPIKVTRHGTIHDKVKGPIFERKKRNPRSTRGRVSRRVSLLTTRKIEGSPSWLPLPHVKLEDEKVNGDGSA